MLACVTTVGQYFATVNEFIMKYAVIEVRQGRDLYSYLLVAHKLYDLTRIAIDYVQLYTRLGVYSVLYSAHSASENRQGTVLQSVTNGIAYLHVRFVSKEMSVIALSSSPPKVLIKVELTVRLFRFRVDICGYYNTFIILMYC